MSEFNQSMWRNLDEYSGSADWLASTREFPDNPTEWPEALSRRRFMQLAGASLALAGMTGCRQPLQKVYPYVTPPESVVPGKPLSFATAWSFAGYGVGVLATSHLGRPTKIEGNPDHPASLGATNAIAQSSVLMLYDPDRADVTTHLGSVSSWGTLLARLRPVLERLQSKRGAGLRILTETITSPCLAAQMHKVLREYPAARWQVFDPVTRTSISQGAALASGAAADVIYRFDRAERVVALDCDFMFTEPGSLQYARRFIDRRRVSQGKKEMNRLYVAEPTPSLTGSMADHRLAVRAAFIDPLAQALAAEVGVDGETRPAALSDHESRWISAAAKDLLAHPGAGLVLTGLGQPASVHARVHRINHALGNADNALGIDPVAALPPGSEDIASLTADMRAGRVDALIIVGGNPAYSAPADVDFARALLELSQMRQGDGSFTHLTVHLGEYYNETSFRTQWHVPRTHYLESWSDIRAFDGTISLVQPLIAPLHQSRQDIELLSAIVAEQGATAYDILRQYWLDRHGAKGFETFWKTSLERGTIENTAAAAKPLSATNVPDKPSSQPADRPGGLEIVFRPDYCVWDGTFANLGWQQELPRPFTHLTWDNAALVSVGDAEELGIETGDVVELACRSRRIKAPAFVLPGQARGSVTVHLGYGREHGGRCAKQVGFNAFALRTLEAPWFDQGLSIQKTGQRHQFALSSAYHTIDARGFGPFAEQPVVADVAREVDPITNRDLVRTGTLDELNSNPQRLRGGEPLLSLYPEYRYDEHRWAMSIDLGACIGCGACVVACQAENNIPTVGREQVLMSREMHWIRIDQYYQGPPESPRIYNQPVPCMHCEKAPCEVVCPTEATVHDSEGLNNMVYNRCVGTRYCSNNCPYKVRRFNFLRYTDIEHPTIIMQKNPNVTVRNRGVMEKCTYCVQRISEARIEARKENRPIPDSAVQTACQQVCPTRAIIFGDLNVPGSLVSRLKASPLDYSLLTELTTQPRTTYLARIWNPNPALKKDSQDASRT